IVKTYLNKCEALFIKLDISKAFFLAFITFQSLEKSECVIAGLIKDVFGQQRVANFFTLSTWVVFSGAVWLVNLLRTTNIRTTCSNDLGPLGRGFFETNNFMPKKKIKSMNYIFVHEVFFKVAMILFFFSAEIQRDIQIMSMYLKKKLHLSHIVLLARYIKNTRLGRDFPFAKYDIYKERKSSFIRLFS
ncbi:hypothetical protein ACJX0J_037584, partial [Zea mays]